MPIIIRFLNSVCRAAWLCIFLCFGVEVHSQCLIENGGFEQYRNCDPKFLNDNIIGWDNAFMFNSSFGYGPTPDFFNTCFNRNGLCETSYCIPQNIIGNTFSHSGSGYAGIGTKLVSTSNNIQSREYIQVKLSDSLNLNICYHLRFYCFCANYTNSVKSPNIQAFFSDTAVKAKLDVSILPYTLLPLIPQIRNDTSNIDTANWFLVEGYYTAHGGEKYLVLGNFDNDSSTTILQPQNPLGGIAYLFIDDVSLVACDEDTYGSEQVEVCEGDSVYLSKSPLHQRAYCHWNNKRHTPLYDGFAWWFTPTQDTVLYTIRGDSLTTCDLQYDSIIIKLKKCDTLSPPDTILKLALPTAFSPNGDGVNETFYPIGNKPFTLTKFRIYNRWGELVHDAPQPWDGKKNGAAQPQDAYWYIIEYEGKVDKGVVTLMR
jgi:gliding motility-associated-like protein